MKLCILKIFCKEQRSKMAAQLATATNIFLCLETCRLKKGTGKTA